MKTAKKSPMDEYLKKHPFLVETANLQLAMEKILTGAVSPVSFPEKVDIANLVKDGMPLLQQPQLQRTMVKVAAVSLGDCLEALKDMEAPEMMKAAIEAWHSWTDEAELTEIQQFFDCLLRQEDTEIQRFAVDSKLNEVLVRTLGWQIVEVLVPAEVKDPVFWQGIGWKAMESGNWEKIKKTIPMVDFVLPWIGHILFSFLPTFVICLAGAPMVQAMKEFLPMVGIAMKTLFTVGSLLPAVGVAILCKQVINKPLDWVVFGFGFTLAAVMKCNLIASALIAVFFALINYEIQQVKTARPAIAEGSAAAAADDDEEDEDI